MARPARSALFVTGLALLQGCALTPEVQGLREQGVSASSRHSLPSHRSPLSDYRAGPPPALQDWRQANETVGRIGGWRAYLQEAQQTPLAPSVLEDKPSEPAVLTPLPAPAQRGSPAAAPRPAAVMPQSMPDVQWQRTPEQQAAAQAQALALLREPLSADAAIEVALRVHPGLQASLAGLGVTEAEAQQAARLPNPGLSLARLREGGEREIERGLHLNLARLILMPTISALEQRRLEQARIAAAAEVWQRVALVRRAHIEAVAARERSRYMEDVMRAARASAELTRRAAAVGNVGRLQQAREQAFHAEAALAHARAVHEADRSRERLIRAMGLPEDPPQMRLPERLAGLPVQLPAQPDLEQQALSQRLDVQVARLQAEQSARSLGLTRTTRFINVLELGAVRNDKTGAPTQTGWEISLELPLFDWGESRVARAQALYLQSLSQVAQTAAQARSEVREAWRQWRFTHEAARHVRDEILPLRRRVAEENLLRYNGMLIGVHELLADAREQIGAAVNSIDTLRDFWLADADLRLALLAPGAASSDATGAAHAAGAAGAGAVSSSSSAAGGH